MTDLFLMPNGAVGFEAGGDSLRVFHALASDHNYEVEVTIDIDGSPEVEFVLFHGREAFAVIGCRNGHAVLLKGGQPILRDAAPCSGCRHFTTRMLEHDPAV